MESVNFRGMNFATTSGLLTATGAETVHDTTVTIAYCINGKAYTKTAITDGATPTTDAVTGLGLTLTGVASGGGEGAVVVWCLDGSAVKCLFGEKVAVDAAGNYLDKPQFPAIPNTLTPFAYQLLKHYAQGSTVTFGTSNWNTSGFTNAITNVMVLPDRPQ